MGKATHTAALDSSAQWHAQQSFEGLEPAVPSRGNGRSRCPLAPAGAARAIPRPSHFQGPPHGPYSPHIPSAHVQPLSRWKGGR